MINFENNIRQKNLTFLNILDYKRIIIVGNNGSGKSFFAKRLSAITGLPLIYFDAEFWLPNWAMPSKDEWLNKNKEFISKEKWIIDGMCNHGEILELRFKSADLIIFLDINRFVCLSSIFKRNSKKRSDTTAYLYEKFDMRFIEFCKGILTFPKIRIRAIINLHEKYPSKPFWVIKSRKKINKLLDQWDKLVTSS